MANVAVPGDAKSFLTLELQDLNAVTERDSWVPAEAGAWECVSCVREKAANALAG